MRLHYAAAIPVAILLGFGVKWFLFSVPIAAADLHSPAAMNVIQMHIEHANNLPMLEVKDPI